MDGGVGGAADAKTTCLASDQDNTPPTGYHRFVEVGNFPNTGPRKGAEARLALAWCDGS